MWNEARLDEMLTAPSPALAQDLKSLTGDILILGAGGKMGPTLAVLAQRALAGTGKRVIAVSRFTDTHATALLQRQGVETISADLLAPGALAALPDVENIIFMAGRKFGTEGQQHLTWAMNACLPTLVAQRYPGANMVVFSSGNIYPMVPLSSGGATEETPPAPVGEYAMSCLARERIFTHAAREYGTRVCLYRLNYAVDLRYGVLHDLATSILREEPIPQETPVFNIIWQQTANEIALRCLTLAQSPEAVLNVTGPETLSVRATAEKLGALLGKRPVFTGQESEYAYLNNAAKCAALFGYPTVPAETLIQWQAEWLLAGGRSLDKPTHFEQRKGAY